MGKCLGKCFVMIGKMFCKTIVKMFCKMIGKMFCKTINVHILYCNYNKNLYQIRTMEKRGKPRSVLGWFPQLKNHLVHNA